VELRVQSVAYDLHSSNAPLAPNAAWRLVEALGSLHEPSGRVRIPGFYDAVRPPTETERRLMARFPIDPQFLRQSWKVDHLLGSGRDPITLTEHLLYAPTWASSSKRMFFQPSTLTQRPGQAIPARIGSELAQQKRGSDGS
jgi:hypothetical protein